VQVLEKQHTLGLLEVLDALFTAEDSAVAIQRMYVGEDATQKLELAQALVKGLGFESLTIIGDCFDEVCGVVVCVELAQALVKGLGFESLTIIGDCFDEVCGVVVLCWRRHWSRGRASSPSPSSGTASIRVAKCGWCCSALS
jgi:hypothetical protein